MTESASSTPRVQLSDESEALGSATPVSSSGSGEGVAAPHQTAAQIIREIRERVRKATAGPWAWESIAEKSNEFAVGTAFNADGQPLSGRLPEGDWVEDAVIERRGLIGMNESGHANFADADFIAHARTDIPFLLAQLETTASALSEQDEALTALKAERDEYRRLYESLLAARMTQPERERDEARQVAETYRQLYRRAAQEAGKPEAQLAAHDEEHARDIIALLRESKAKLAAQDAVIATLRDLTAKWQQEADYRLTGPRGQHLKTDEYDHALRYCANQLDDALTGQPDTPREAGTKP